MAKVKKKEALSLEEKLEQALVLVDEQPYEVPENWCWTKMEAVCNGFQYGYTEKAVYEEVGPKYIRITDIGDGVINDEKAPYCPIDDKSYESYKIHKDDIFIARMGSVGENGLALTDLDAIFASYLIRLVPKISAKFITFYLQSGLYWGQISEKSQGTTRLNVNANILRMLMFPLPPLAEQQRIVGQIESLFVKLDEAKEKAQNVIDNYDMTVFAILHKAFIGELSAKWRVNNGINKDSWSIKKINEVCTPRAGYAFDSKKFQSSGCQIIRMGNLYGGVLDLSRSPVYMDESELDAGIIKRAKIHDGDILITLTGTKYKRDYGYAVCIEKSENLYVNQRILCLTPNDDIDRDYLLYYLRSNIFRDVFFSNETGGVNQGNVSSKFVENIELQVPSLREQQVIATMLTDILTKEEQAKELAESVVQQIDLLKKSILAKAFRGELGTNNPDEESAVELLKKIITEEIIHG